MNFTNLTTFKKIYNPNLIMLGLDVGSKYIGISVSHPNKKREAIALHTLERNEFSKKFPVIVSKCSPVQLVVVGVPSCNVSNTKKIIHFISTNFLSLQLEKIPVLLQDERNSTLESKLALKEQEEKVSKFMIDAYSAKLILERFLKKL
jgi:putative transcription antitermination factor YqgF